MSRAYSIRVLEVLSGIRLVKATGNEEREYQQLKKLIRDREKADFESQVNSAAITPVSEVTGIVALMLIVFLSRILFADEINSLSAVVLTYLLVLLRLLPFISQLNTVRSQFANTAASVKIVDEFLRQDNKPFMGSGSVPYTALQDGVYFNQVSFAYSNHPDLVLQDVNLYLPRGTTLALVGASGAGKSTLADLLPRFYDPTADLCLHQRGQVRALGTLEPYKGKVIAIARRKTKAESLRAASGNQTLEARRGLPVASMPSKRRQTPF